MKQTPIKALFFDIGSVLLTNGWDHLARSKAVEQFNLDHEEVEVLHNFIFNVYEIGHVSLNNYLETVVFNQARDFTMDEFKAFMFSSSQELPHFLSWLREWKKSCTIPILSLNNEGKELNDYRIKTFSLHDVFDGFISSCEVGIRKPDPRIYRLAMGIAHVQPDECAYFDDRIILVKAAQKLGIQSFQHRSFESTKEILENLKKQQ